MDSWFRRKQQKQADRVHPPEMVGDYDEGAIGDPFATADVKAKEQVKEAAGASPRDSKNRARATADRQHVGRWNRSVRHIRRRPKLCCIPFIVQAYVRRCDEAFFVPDAPAVVAVEV